jgi:glucose/arabinose dehydrogenase
LSGQAIPEVAVSKLHRRSAFYAALAATCLLPAAARAQGPPPPTATNGQPVTTVATGVTTPTAFAFAGATVFAGSGPAEGPGGGPTGLFTLAGGHATKVPGTPPVVFGLAWHKHRLYVSTGAKIIAFSGWNGTRFAASRTISAPGKAFAGYNGLAFGRGGRLFAGVSFHEKYDHARDPSRYAQSVVSMTATGKRVRTVARGLRQPFQLTFVGRGRHPYVTVLSQDKGKIPKDAIVVARNGQDYGFPACRWGTPRTCRGFAKPAFLLPKHASPMGIGALGNRLFVSLFGGLGDGKPVVVTMPAGGGAPKPFLQGFVAPVIALGVHAGLVYVGDLTGTIYAVKGSA